MIELEYLSSTLVRMRFPSSKQLPSSTFVFFWQLWRPGAVSPVKARHMVRQNSGNRPRVGMLRDAPRAEDARGTPTQSHISPSILVYERKRKEQKAGLVRLLPGIEIGWSGIEIGCRVLVAIVYRQVFKVPCFLHFEPSLRAFSSRSNVIISTMILSLARNSDRLQEGQEVPSGGP